MGAFGEKLRKQREHRGITLEAVANTTKISTRMLKALEDEHFDQLPGGVFNKGFVRAYARQVGINEEEAINDYLAALAESQVHSHPIIPNFRNTPARPTFESRPENKFENKADNKSSSADIRLDRGNAVAADRRVHTDRRIEARRSQDHLTGVAKTDDHLRQDRLPEQPTDDRPTDNRKSDDSENGNRPNPAFIAESPDRGEDRVVDHAERSAHADALVDAPIAVPKQHPPQDHLEGHFKNHPKENFHDDDLPAAPPSFLNLSSAPQSYAEREKDVPESDQPENQEREEPALLPIIRRSPSQPIRWRKLAIPLLLVVIVILFVVFLRRNRPVPQLAAALQPTAPAQAAPASAAPGAANPIAPAKVSASNASSSGNATAPTSSPSSPHLSSQTPAPAEPSSDVTRIIPLRAQRSKLKPLPAFTLIIRATENSSVAITADGQSIAQENLIAPAATSVRATKEIVVKASNAAGVSFMLNGKDIPATGAEGQPQTYIFDANGLRNSSPASAENPTN